MSKLFLCLSICIHLETSVPCIIMYYSKTLSCEGLSYHLWWKLILFAVYMHSIFCLKLTDVFCFGVSQEPYKSLSPFSVLHTPLYVLHSAFVRTKFLACVEQLHLFYINALSSSDDCFSLSSWMLSGSLVAYIHCHVVIVLVLKRIVAIVCSWSKYC